MTELIKFPGVRPLGIAEIFRRGMGKLVIMDTGQQAKLACGCKQLCGGIEAGIEGAAHAIRSKIEENDVLHFSPNEIDLPSNLQSEMDEIITEEYEDEDGPEGVELIDAKNGFNNLARYAMIWTVRHEQR